MRPLLAILWAKLRISRHTVASIRRESRLKIAVVSFSAGLLWLGALAAFYKGLAWVHNIGGAGPGEGMNLGELLMGNLLSVLAVALLMMLVFSNVLIAYSTLYRSREVAFLLHTPLGARTFFLARFTECVSFSSWASAYLGSPLILAYGAVTGASPLLYLAAVAMFVPFVTIPAAWGSVITMALARVFPRLNRATLLGTGALAVALLFLYLRQRFSAMRMSQDNILTLFFESTGRTQSPFLPSYWAVHGLLAAAAGRYRDALFDFGLLAANALFFTWLAAEAAARLFYPGWSTLAGMDRARIFLPGSGLLGKTERALRALPEPARSLMAKDIRLFWRDPTQWSQFAIFFGIMAVYIANLGNRHMFMQTESYRAFIAGLNMGACALIAATLTSRFVFPLISLEGRRFWIIGLAPVPLSRIVWQKFWLSVATTSVFTVTLILLSGRLLRLDAVPFALSVYSILAVNFGLAGLAVGLGSLYPNFREDNPARIVSGMGGTLNFLLSIGYIALVIAAQTLILQWEVLNRRLQTAGFPWALAGVIVLITGVTAMSALLPMRLGLRNLRRLEF